MLAFLVRIDKKSNETEMAVGSNALSNCMFDKYVIRRFLSSVLERPVLKFLLIFLNFNAHDPSILLLTFWFGLIKINLAQLV